MNKHSDKPNSISFSFENGRWEIIIVLTDEAAYHLIPWLHDCFEIAMLQGKSSRHGNNIVLELSLSLEEGDLLKKGLMLGILEFQKRWN